MVLCGFRSENRPHQSSGPEGNARCVAGCEKCARVVRGIPGLENSGRCQRIAGAKFDASAAVKNALGRANAHLAGQMVVVSRRTIFFWIYWQQRRPQSDGLVNCRTSNGSDDKTKASQVKRGAASGDAASRLMRAIKWHAQ